MIYYRLMKYSPEMPVLPSIFDDETIPFPALITFEGEAGSGKGTCSKATKVAAERLGLKVVLIDQGIKFRTLGLTALESGVDLQDPAATDAFLSDESIPQMLAVRRSQIEQLDPDAQEDLLYTPQLNDASKRIGGSDFAHPTAISALYKEVTKAVYDDSDLIIVDGRAMEKYGKLIDNAGYVDYLVGFYFRCGDVSAASHRAPDVFGKDFESNYNSMSDTQKAACFDEIMRIRQRNKDDSQRKIDPMTEPVETYRLDLQNFPYDDPQWDHNFLSMAGVNMVTVVTTHNTITQMTKPVVRLGLTALGYRHSLKT
jgi:cytidylate kinase